jgi:hypothetical protein
MECWQTSNEFFCSKFEGYPGVAAPLITSSAWHASAWLVLGGGLTDGFHRSENVDLVATANFFGGQLAVHDQSP